MIETAFELWKREYDKDICLNPGLLRKLENDFINLCEVFEHNEGYTHHLKIRYDKIQSEL